jgi:Protein kinase domain
VVGVQGVELQVLESGTEFGGYRIEGLLGRGGMSEVYRASNPRLGNTIAVKLLTRELGRDEIFRERFVRESQLAASLNHPNVIPIFDAGEADGLPYIAMRYVEGSDLQELLTREGALSVEAAISIVAQIGAALDCAHEKGLIHRDVKPANILIESNGESVPHVYLSDFGVAKHGGSRSGLTSTGQFVGTVDYIAPEQIEGKGLSGATDVYSLACVLYQTLAGAPPFDRDTDVGMIYAHLVEPPPAITERRPDLPVELDAVLARALSKRPADRYQSCRELVTAVRQAVGVASGATVSGGTGSRAPATRLAPVSAPPTTAAPAPAPPTTAAPTPVPPTTAAPAPGLTPVGTVLAGAGSTAAADGSPLAAAERTQAADGPAPAPAAKVMPTELAERKTVLTRRFWRSKRMLVAVAAALIIGGAAAAAAQTLGGGSSSPKQQSGTKGKNSSNGDGGSVSGTGATLAERRKKQKAANGGKSTTKSTKKTLSSRRASSSKKAKKTTSSKSTGGTLSSRRQSSSSSSSGSTNNTLSSRRSSSSSSSSSSSGSTSSTLSSRRSSSSGSSSSGSTQNTLSSRRNK